MIMFKKLVKNLSKARRRRRRRKIEGHIKRLNCSHGNLKIKRTKVYRGFFCERVLLFLKYRKSETFKLLIFVIS